jgi:hypothetical protein
MLMEKLVEWLAGETEVLGENLVQSLTISCCLFDKAISRGLCQTAVCSVEDGMTGE